METLFEWLCFGIKCTILGESVFHFIEYVFLIFTETSIRAISILRAADSVLRSILQGA